MANSATDEPFSQEEILYFIHHIFLPPKLPQESDADPHLDDALLRLVALILEKYQDFVEEQETETVVDIGKAVCVLREVTGIAGEIDEAKLVQAMGNLTSSGLTVPLYVAAQNAGIIISKSDQESIQFEVFELSPLNHAVMSTQGRLRRTFPGPALIVNSIEFARPELLSTLAQTLAKMSHQTALNMRPKARKAGQDQDEDRDTTDPGLVTELLLSFLRPFSSPAEVTRIQKNTREEVLWRDCRSPWRRSPLWLLVRVIMQLRFTRSEAGSGSFRPYKSFIIFFLAQVLDLALALDNGRPPPHPDLVYCMSAKISRRMLKLESSGAEKGIKMVKEILVRAKKHLDQRWLKVVTNNNKEENINLHSLASLHFDQDVSIPLPELDSFMSRIFSSDTETEPTFTPPVFLQRHDANCLPSISLPSSNDYVAFSLAAFEDWVALYLSSWLSGHLSASDTCEALWKLMAEYHSAATSHYSGNPELTSRMLITIFELWVACDKAAICHSALLQDYDPLIPLGPLRSLLLPRKGDMARLVGVEKYIEARKSRKSRRGSILREYGTRDCFTVRYFDKSPKHRSLMSVITAAAERERQDKYEELESKKRKYARLSQLYDRTHCTYVAVWNPVRKASVNRHAGGCLKCSYRNQMESINISMHEWPLPSREDEAKSVVFELAVPAPFGAWRQATVFLLAEVLQFEYSSAENAESRYSLDQYNGLEQYFCHTGSASENAVIGLQSAAKPQVVTHRNNQHIAVADEQSVCVNNGLRYRYYDSARECFVHDFCETDAVLNSCTHVLTPASATLRPFLLRSFDDAVDQTPNSVIASQYQCPAHLSLAEYRALAAIPVGHLIQWENILVQLACPTVDFKKPETLIFVLQTINQTGPRDADRPVHRAGHTILDDTRFCQKILDTIGDAAQRVKKNWESVHALNAFVNITARVLSLGVSACKQNAITTLAMLRDIALCWVEHLQNKSDQLYDDTQRADFLAKTAEVALVCCGTFDVSREHLAEILRSRQAASAFVKCAIIIDECSPRSATYRHKIVQLIMRQRWRQLSYRAYPIMQNLVVGQEAPTFLDDAISKIIPDYYRGDGLWQKTSGQSDEWLVVKVGTASHRELEVHYNLLTGELLVNGRPLARLPADYERHETYRKLFNLFTFNVMPSSVPGMQFSSTHMYHGHTLHFGLDSSGSQKDLLVQASKDDELVFDLVPSRVFRGRLPEAFVNGYIHWFDHFRDTIEFRPITQQWISTPKCWTLTWLDDDGWKLTRSGASLVDPQSKTGKQIAAILSPLQPPLLIHITLLPGLDTLEIELPGLQLGFTLERGTRSIKSRQFRGLAIDERQCIDTLVGLRSKLVLASEEQKYGGNRTILIPAGRVSYAQDGDHVIVTIDPSPGPAHAYKLDSRLGRIVDNGSLPSKMLLAYIHALTSFCLADPFTQKTGTEQSLEILSSAAVRSFPLLDEESMNLLSCIADLAPQRVYYPQHEQLMQTVKWSSQIGFLAQHGRFYKAVEALFEQIRSARVYYPDSFVNPPELRPMSNALLKRDLSRSSTFRLSDFGAEDYLPGSKFDTVYNARDWGLATPRAERSLEAATILFRGKPDIHRLPDAHLSRLLWNFLERSDEDVEGPRGESLPLDTFHYDGKWLGNHSSSLAAVWCRIHKQLNVSSDRPFDSFRLMMWLATMAFAKTANMEVIRTMAAIFTLPSLGTVQPPDVDFFCLEDGHEPTHSWLEDVLSDQAHDFESCPESQLPDQDSETLAQADARRTKAWQTKRDEAIESFADYLRRKWPCEEPTEPDDWPTRRNARFYLNTRKSLKKITPMFTSCFNNRRFKLYLENIESVIRRSPIRSLNLPTKIPLESDCTGHIPVPVVGRRGRFLTSWDIFESTPPPEPNTEVKQVVLKTSAWLEVDSRAAPSFSRLQALVCYQKGVAQTAYESKYAADLGESLDELQARPRGYSISPDEAGLEKELKKYLKKCKKRAGKLFDDILLAAGEAAGDMDTAFLLTLHHAPRVSPMFLLQQLAHDRRERLPERWKECIVRYGIAFADVQRAERLMRCRHNRNDLIKELQNPGHTNWDALSHPDSLLLEIESGITIREVQERIAEQMREPPGQKNAVMQLNMGEGKSSVIVPIVAASLADGSALVRVMVAKPQSKQMSHTLVSKLGGLLNRPIFYLPFSRALDLGLEDAALISEMCRRCVEMRGVMLVQPEHTLSVKLMCLERLITGRESIGKCLLQAQYLFDTATRDIVDESDENFSVKFEQVYAMGQQRPICFAPERWIIMQAVLGLVQEYAPQIKAQMPRSIEVQEQCKGSFPRVRLLRQDAEAALSDHVARHICETGFPGFPISRQTKTVRLQVLNYISERDLDEADIAAVEEGHFWSEATRDALLLLRGLLAAGVLRFVLGQKRWRVNYGVDSTRRPVTKLAVPFKAKDNPTPRSEFSHPDVIIAVTCLSYYYGGLDDDDLFLAFHHLVVSDQADAEYQEWLGDAPSLPKAFRQLQGINLKDTAQCKKEVFEHLRHAKRVVDYFLSQLVFPKFVKEFPQKLSASGWDIGAAKPRPTTGFSGTIDSREVLPLDVAYLGLAEQKHTNALVLEYLLRPENTVAYLSPHGRPSSRVQRENEEEQGIKEEESIREEGERDAIDGGGGGGNGDVRSLARITDAEALLAVVVEMRPPVRVILDVGAQVLELTNIQVVRRWLEMVNDGSASSSDVTAQVQAAIFFDDNEEMQVLDRKGRVERFQISPFSEQLDRCLVFLDDSHTRGTDLRLPDNYRAAVTLGANLTKDRLVQACMRMRKLGAGQSLVICLSEEITAKIKELEEWEQLGSEIGMAHVLAWTISETHANLRQSMPLWAAQGTRFARQQTLWSESLTNDGFQTMSAGQAERFLEDEAQTLDDRYRPQPAQIFIKEAVSPKQYAQAEDAVAIGNRLQEIRRRCREVGSVGSGTAALQEEQERELSPEVEEEREVERPPPACPRRHSLHRDVQNFASSGILPAGPVGHGFMPAFQALGNTSAAAHFDLDQFPPSLLVTQDFAHTLALDSKRSASDYLDAFQRPVQWILTGRTSKTNNGKGGGGTGEMGEVAMVIISPFEAQKLQPLIQAAVGKSVARLHIYSPRPNLEIRPLDGLELYAIPALPAPQPAAPPALVRQLNLFAGQLYLGSFAEYQAFCDMLGLSWEAAREGLELAADGFILERLKREGDEGESGAVCTFRKSPVRFLKEFLTKVRRDCQSIERAHVGWILAGGLLLESDFADEMV